MMLAMLVMSVLQAPDVVRLALVSDPHVTRGTKDDQPLYRPRFEAAVKTVNEAHVDAVLLAGDLTEGGRPEQYDDYAALSKGFTAPLYAVPGNHDVGAKHLPNEKGTTAARNAEFARRVGPVFWAHDVKGVHLVGLDSPILGSGLPEEERQWAFLDRELVARPGRRTVVLGHYPPFLDSPEEPGGAYWNIEPAPRKRLLDLVRRSGALAFLSGHLHRPLDHDWSGIRLLSTPPVSFGLPRGEQPEGWTLVEIDGQKVTSRFVPISLPEPKQP